MPNIYVNNEREREREIESTKLSMSLTPVWPRFILLRDDGPSSGTGGIPSSLNTRTAC